MGTWLSVIGLAATLISGGVAILLTFPNQQEVALWLGWLPTGLGALLLAGSLLYPPARVLALRVRSFLVERRVARLEHSFTVIPVNETLIENICIAGRHLVGDRHPPGDVLKERWKHNRRTILAVAPVDNQSAVAGYFVLYALKKSACRSLDDGRVGSARELHHTRDFCKDFRKATGVYVSMVMANDEIPFAKAYILHLLFRHVHAYCSLRGLCIYARPYTKAGHRLVKRRGFQEINAQAGLWRLVLA